MENFIQHIEASLPKGNDKTLYKFKKKTIDEMTELANSLTATGLKDDKVLSDLVISEYSDIAEQYEAYANEKNIQRRRKRFALGNIIGSAVYIVTLIIVFLGVSFATQEWGLTWVIVADGFLLWATYLCALGVNRIVKMKRIFHGFARILLAIGTMTFSVAVFLFCLGLFQMPYSWLIIIGGIALMFVLDAIFATVTKQKLAIIFWLIYIPPVFAMLFIIICALELVAWSVGWVMIPLSLLIDLAIIIIMLQKNKSYKEEVADSWQEN